MHVSNLDSMLLQTDPYANVKGKQDLDDCQITLASTRIAGSLLPFNFVSSCASEESTWATRTGYSYLLLHDTKVIPGQMTPYTAESGVFVTLLPPRRFVLPGDR